MILFVILRWRAWLGPNPTVQEGRNALAFGKPLPSQVTSDQLAKDLDGTLKDLDDLMFRLK